MNDFLYANITASIIELSEIENPSHQVRDAIKRLNDCKKAIFDIDNRLDEYLNIGGIDH